MDNRVEQRHRVLNAGAYNRHVTDCTFCGASIDIFGADCIGFAESPTRAGYIDKTLAVVYGCPHCFERQWSHTTVEGGYYQFLRWQHKNPKAEL